MMKRVTGIGGVFFKSKDPEKIKEWYKTHLGIKSDQYGGMFQWRKYSDPEQTGCTVWSPFKDDTTYFEPSGKPFMVNYRVKDLEKLLEVLKEEGVQIAGEMESYEYGKFAWIVDPDGTKIELWEPVDGELTGAVNDQD
ncbi:MAG: VOC family protein [bacterium]|nr:VOC family protein [bacterium]